MSELPRAIPEHCVPQPGAAILGQRNPGSCAKSTAQVQARPPSHFVPRASTAQGGRGTPPLQCPTCAKPRLARSRRAVSPFGCWCERLPLLLPLGSVWGFSHAECSCRWTILMDLAARFHDRPRTRLEKATTLMSARAFHKPEPLGSGTGRKKRRRETSKGLLAER